MRRLVWPVTGAAAVVCGGLIFAPWAQLPAAVLTEQTLIASAELNSEAWLAFSGRQWHPSVVALWVAAGVATAWTALQRGWLRRAVAGLTQVLLTALWLSALAALLKPQQTTELVIARHYGVHLTDLTGVHVTGWGCGFLVAVIVWQVAAWGTFRTPPARPQRNRTPVNHSEPSPQHLWKALDDGTEP